MTQRNVSLILLLILSSITSFAQTKVNGRVVDIEDKQPLIGAQIVVESKGVGTVADESGFFEIKLPVGSNTIKIKYLGYETKSLSVNNSAADLGIIALARASTALDEVIVSSSSNNFKEEFKTPISTETFLNRNFYGK